MEITKEKNKEKFQEEIKKLSYEPERILRYICTKCAIRKSGIRVGGIGYELPGAGSPYSGTNRVYYQ